MLLYGENRILHCKAADRFNELKVKEKVKKDVDKFTLW